MMLGVHQDFAKALSRQILVKQDQITDSESRLLGLIEGAEKRLRTAATNAITAAREAPGTLEELTELLEQGRIEEAIQAASQAGAIRISDGYATVYTLAGQNGSEFLEGILEITIGFDRVNERAVRHMQSERLRFIREFTNEQREANRFALVDGIERGLNPIEQARNFRSSIGLTSYQQTAVQNYRKLLERGAAEALSRGLRDRRFDRTLLRAIRSGEPLTAGQVNRMVERYTDRYVSNTGPRPSGERRH